MNKFGHGGYASFAIGCFWFFLGPSSNVAAARYAPPAPKYEVRLQKSLWVAMRDGIRLATGLYWPKGLTRDLAAILRGCSGSTLEHRRRAANCTVGGRCALLRMKFAGICATGCYTPR